MMTNKQLFTAMGGGVLFVASAQAQAVIYEPFDYPEGGSTVSGNDGGVGFAGAWTNTRNNPNLDAAGLSYGSLAVAGGKARGAAWSGLARPIGSTLLSEGLLDDGATLWMSAILDLSGANLTNADLNISLTNSDKFVSNAFGNRYDLNGDTSEGVGFGHTGGNVRGAWWQDSGNADGDAERNLSGESTLQMSSNGVGNPTFAYVVAKIEWGVGSADETITLYSPNSSSLAIGSPVLGATAIPGLDQSTFDTLAIQFKDSTPSIDEIRFAASYDDVVGLPKPMTLQVDTITGAATILGNDGDDVQMNYYQVKSDAGSLDISGWDSLADQDFDGNGPANGSGDGWEEAGGSGANALGEAYLLGSSTVASGAQISIGTIYDTALDAQDLFFSYRNQNGLEVEGIVEYVQSALPGDTDGDGDVDDSDLGTAFSNYTGPVGDVGKTTAQGDVDGDGDVDDSDLGSAFSNYTGPIAVQVPEPTSLAILALAGAALARTRR